MSGCSNKQETATIPSTKATSSSQKEIEQETSFSKIGREILRVVSKNKWEEVRTAAGTPSKRIDALLIAAGEVYDKNSKGQPSRMPMSRDAGMKRFKQDLQRSIDLSFSAKKIQRIKNVTKLIPGFENSEFVSASPFANHDVDKTRGNYPAFVHAGGDPYDFWAIYFRTPAAPNLIYRIVNGACTEYPDGVAMFEGVAGIEVSRGDGIWLPLRSDGMPDDSAGEQDMPWSRSLSRKEEDSSPDLKARSRQKRGEESVDARTE